MKSSDSKGEICIQILPEEGKPKIL